jgi:tetratricopeptide (TPR) repeat protein
VLRESGDLGDAEQTANVALKINEAAYGAEALPVAVTLTELGVIYLNQSLHDAAEAAAIRGLKILQKLKLDDTDPYTTRLLDIRGRAEATRGDYVQATATFQELLKLDRMQVGVDHPKYATHLANFATVKEAQGKYKQAESDYRKTIDVYANGLNRACHPNLIDTYANLGSLLRARKSSPADLREAKRYLTEALRLGQKVRGATHILTANDFANLGRLTYDYEDRRGALRYFVAAVRIYDKNLKRNRIGPTYVYVAEVLTWVGRLLVEGGTDNEVGQSIVALERAVKIWAAQSGPPDVGYALAKACLGHALFLKKLDDNRARQLLTEGYAGVSEALGAKHPLAQQIKAWLDELSSDKAKAA